MIKRTVALLLTMAYAITAVGFAFDLHYCCNRLVFVSINSPVKSCGMAAFKSKCCKNSHIEVKVKDAHQGEAVSLLSDPCAFEMPPRLFGSFSVFEAGVVLINYDTPDPPHPPCPNYLKNCTFRI